MSQTKKIRSALISVFHKDHLEPIITKLHNEGVRLISTGGTRSFIEGLGYPCTAVEDLTGYPSILGGRVKTLHPKIFGGILARRDNDSDAHESAQYEIDPIDLVIVDLYPFEDTVASGASEADIIEKIDIGGISLIRAAAKNFADVAIVASKRQYPLIAGILDAHGAETTLEERRLLAREAFAVSSGYDTAIYNWFADTTPLEDSPLSSLRVAVDGAMALRYGENPHQSASYFGDFDKLFDKLHGKEISYNNLLDIDAACALIDEFDQTTVAILKHNNACGCASRGTVAQAWADALAGKRLRTILGGVLVQDTDTKNETSEDLKLVAGDSLSEQQIADMLFANKLVKHSKSNAIVLARDGQLLASGVGQTSRVDALRHAIEKAHSFNFDLKGATMASDAFFPFADCVEIAHSEGIYNVIQPGGSIRDTDSVKYCQENGMTMVMTGFRHFRH